MRVAVYPADRYACGHYRCAWPAQMLHQQGADVVVVPPKGQTGIAVRVQDGEIVDGYGPKDVDVIVLQRPARTNAARAVPFLREKGYAVVVDVDDDLSNIHPSNSAFRGMHPRSSPDYNWANVAYACRHATLVTVSTPALAARYASHGRVRLIRNYVPARFLEMPHDPLMETVGWAGSLHSHPGDLDQAAGALARLAREGHELRFVGPSKGVSKKLGVELGEGAFTGNLGFGDWQPAVAERIGVGVAPLADTRFNECKSWLKPLEYSAAGAPWVASDTPEYARIAAMCGAPTASRPRDWYRELKRLLTDEQARVDASGRAREAASKLTIEGHVHEWAEAWEAAYAARRGDVARV